jgi:hypothetical protein
VPPSETDKYGIVETERAADGTAAHHLHRREAGPVRAPSNLAVVGRYLLTPTIFDKLHQTTPGAGGEIQLTDAIAALLKEETVIAHPFTGKRYDCGSKGGYLQATVEYALEHPELPSWRLYSAALPYRCRAHGFYRLPLRHPRIAGLDGLKRHSRRPTSDSVEYNPAVRSRDNPRSRPPSANQP